MKKILIGLVCVLGVINAQAFGASALAMLLQAGAFAFIKANDKDAGPIQYMNQQDMQLNIHLEFAISKAYPKASAQEAQMLKNNIWNIALGQKEVPAEQFVRVYTQYINQIAAERAQLSALSSINKYQTAVDSGKVCSNMKKEQSEEFLKIIETVWNPWPQDVSKIWAKYCQEHLKTLN